MRILNSAEIGKLLPEADETHEPLIAAAIF
jgi:hypothetical protein